MKIRKGFVSNSSSSSFIVLLKDEEMSLEEMKAKSIKILNGYCDYGDDPEEIETWVNKPAQEYAEKGQYILMKERVEWGAEEVINNIIPKLLDKLGVDSSKVAFEWDE